MNTFEQAIFAIVYKIINANNPNVVVPIVEITSENLKNEGFTIPQGKTMLDYMDDNICESLKLLSMDYIPSNSDENKIVLIYNKEDKQQQESVDEYSQQKSKNS